MRVVLAISAAAIAVAAPLSTNAAVSTTKDWQGHWRTSCWGNVLFFQNGKKVTGSAAGNGGRIAGTARGLKLVGKWTKSSSKNGTFAWTLSSTGKRFHGHWTYKGTSKPCAGAFRGGF